MADWILLFLTALAAIGGTSVIGGLLVKYYYRTNFDFSFSDKSKKLQMHNGEQRRACFELTNVSRGKGRKLEAGFLYLPSSFAMSNFEVEGGNLMVGQNFPSMTTGRFKNYHYANANGLYFSRGEASRMCITLTAPSDGGLFTIYVVLHFADSSTVERNVSIAVA